MRCTRGGSFIFDGGGGYDVCRLSSIIADEGGDDGNRSRKKREGWDEGKT